MREDTRANVLAIRYLFERIIFFFSIKFLRVDFLDIEEIFDGIIIFEHFLYGGWMFLKVIENSGLSSECIWWITGCCYFLYVQVFFIN